MIIVGLIIDSEEAEDIEEVAKISILGKQIRNLLHQILFY
jgi:hypothetical protein